VLRRHFLSAASLAPFAAAAAPPPPNVLLIFCDDLGYGDLGAYGGKIPTPHLDRLASEGVRFTNFYSANPVCSPSRASLLTGRYPTRVGVPRVLFPPDPGGLNEDEQTLAALLKSRGYRTGCVGKWHLGRPEKYLPTSRGFDSYYGIPYSNDMNPPCILRNTTVEVERADMNTLSPLYSQEAVKFLRQKSDRPFFLYFPHTFPHIPLGASDRFRGKSAQGLYGDVIQELDWTVGELLKTLRETGAERNTLVLFSSDNGPWYEGSPGILRGRKGMTWEGGVRVPFLARWPGRIPKGRVVDGIASALDVVPTVAKLCGAPMPAKPVDGIDVWPLLSGAAPSLNRDVLLYFDGWHLQCARSGPWKLHLARYNNVTYSPAPSGGRVNLPLTRPELYNLDTDPNESYDVAAQHPDVVARISKRVEDLIAGFPEEVRQAWSGTRAIPAPPVPAGSLPRRPA
jgi:arylsulfatase